MIRMNSIVEFWKNCNGPVHPEDQNFLDGAPGVFNLSYPPPAYIGDIENAPIVLLNGNGGYNAQVTLPNSPMRMRMLKQFRDCIILGQSSQPMFHLIMLSETTRN